MKRGQIFILAAFVIALMIAELGNIYTYSNLPAQTAQTKVSDSADMLKNVQNEIYYVAAINDAALLDFVRFLGNFSGQRGYNISYVSNSSPG